MLNTRFLACTKVELWDLIVCVAVNGEKFRSRAVTLALVRQFPILNSSELFSYTTMYSNFMFLDQFLFELSCKNPHTHTHTHMHTHIFEKRNYKYVVEYGNGMGKFSVGQCGIKVRSLYHPAKFNHLIS